MSSIPGLVTAALLTRSFKLVPLVWAPVCAHSVACLLPWVSQPHYGPGNFTEFCRQCYDFVKKLRAEQKRPWVGAAPDCHHHKPSGSSGESQLKLCSNVGQRSTTHNNFDMKVEGEKTLSISRQMFLISVWFMSCHRIKFGFRLETIFLSTKHLYCDYSDENMLMYTLIHGFPF